MIPGKKSIQKLLENYLYVQGQIFVYIRPSEVQAVLFDSTLIAENANIMSCTSLDHVE